MSVLLSDRTLGAATYPSVMMALSVRRHTKVLATGEGWLGRTQVGVTPEHRSTAMLLSVPALLCACKCDSVCSTIAPSVQFSSV